MGSELMNTMSFLTHLELLEFRNRGISISSDSLNKKWITFLVAFFSGELVSFIDILQLDWQHLVLTTNIRMLPSGNSGSC